MFDWTGGYDRMYLLYHPLFIVNQFFRNMKWGWQRFYRGWDDRVIWGIDSYLSEMMPIWLEKLKEDKIGTPITFFPNNYTGDDPELEKKAKEEWNSVLDEMINGFKSAEKILNYADDDEENYKKHGRAMDLFKEHYFSLWD